MKKKIQIIKPYITSSYFRNQFLDLTIEEIEMWVKPYNDFIIIETVEEDVKPKKTRKK